MKEIEIFYLTGCPYCDKARKAAEELRGTDDRYAALSLRWIEESREKELAVIVIIHDLNLAARFADRIVILDGGRIVETGTPDEVLREDILSEVYDTPVKVIRDPDDGIIILPSRTKDNKYQENK